MQSFKKICVVLFAASVFLQTSGANAQTKGIAPAVYNASTGKFVRYLTSDETLNLTGQSITICLTFATLKPKSVIFFWNGVQTLTQSKAPFCINSLNAEAGLIALNVANATYSINTRLYSEKKGKGTLLGRKNFTFTITRSSTTAKPAPPANNSVGGTLKAAAIAAHRDVGFAVTPSGLANPTYAAIVKKEATLIGAENVFKPGYLLKAMNSRNPKDWEWDWSDADKILSFAKANGIKVRGHALFWHQSVATEGDGGAHDFETLVQTSAQTVQFMKDYSLAVFKHIEDKYPKLQVEWDVANEGFVGCKGDCKDAPDSAFNYRTGSIWYSRLGRDWIRQAFLAADQSRRAIGRSDLKLVYNDFLDYKNACHFIGRMKKAGVPVDAFGLQTHIAPVPDSQSSYEGMLKACASYGLRTRITELDHVLNLPVTDKDKANQVKAYGNITRACMASGTNCDMLVTWGVYDGAHASVWYSRNAAVKQGYPLMFDVNFQKKPAYTEMLKGLSGN